MQYQQAKAKLEQTEAETVQPAVSIPEPLDVRVEKRRQKEKTRHLNTDMQGLQVVESDHHAQNWNQTYVPETKYLAGGGTLNDITNSRSRETTGPSSNSITSNASQSESPSTGTTTASTTSSAPVTTGTTGMAENPCPGANRTTITASSGKLFSLFCGVYWPRGIEAADGNGTVGDLGRSTKYILDDCIETCIQYNKGDAAVVDSVDGGTCRAVVYQVNLTAVYDGGQDRNCFLKDRIGS
ncbi:hypothetical protein Plec18167_007123 [Paecilomyces lecythidis]|uniref:Apple domain-containing protein n=1 Tax=Paecilomyces lecythidis TaxID=3004212 RepID=A0ABR3X6E4_9EURO